MNRVSKKETAEIFMEQYCVSNAGVEVSSRTENDAPKLNKTVEALRPAAEPTVSFKSFEDDIFNSLVDSVVIINTEMVIKLVNQATLRLTGFSEEELIGKPIEILSKNKKLYNKIINRNLLKNNFKTGIETQCLRKDGSSFPISLSASKIYDAQTGNYNIVCVSQDITKRKRLEAESKVISKIIHGVTLTSNLDELLRLIHESIGKILYAENCFVALYDDKTGLLNMQFFVDKYDAAPPPLKLGKSLTAYVFRKGTAMLMTGEVIEQLIAKGEIELLGTDSPVWLGVPLRTPKGIIGVLVVQHYEDKDAYTQHDLKFLTSIGDQIALAIERKQAENALHESQRTIFTLMSNLPGMVYRCLNDENWTMKFVSKGCFDLTGYEASELLENKKVSFSDLIYRDDQEMVWQNTQKAVSQGKPFQLTYRINTADGGMKWVWEQGQGIIDDNGQMTAIEGFIIDITDRKKAEEDLRKSQDRFHLVTRATNDAIWDWDLTTEHIWWNEGFQKLFGYQAEEVGSGVESWTSRIHPEDIERVTRDINRLIDSRQPNWQGEYRFRRADGSYAFVINRGYVVYENNKSVRMIGSMMDVTERKSLEEQLTHQALHDPLTKLANRVLFSNRVEHALAKIDRNKNSVAVLFLDLDNFKAVNDSLGHAAGDALLLSVADRLRVCLRNSDTPARLGGDEFAILLEETKHTEEAVMVAERIKDVLRTPFSIEGKEVFVGTSIGVAIAADASIDSEKLLRNADVAMYTAKSQGKGHYVIFEDKMHEMLMERIEIETDLRRAIDNEEFVLHYQPIIDLQTQRVTGMESLVRWNHPEQGLIYPGKFIPVAEETNLIVPLGKWILREACTQAQVWRKEYAGDIELSITVNLSMRQFQQKDLVDMVSSVIKETGLNPECLILEITESFMLQNTEATISKLHELKKLGIKLAIDDFGTGYSSLSYLQRFPIDILKIDKSFVDKINHGKEGVAVAKAIIMMGDSLNLKTIAEGIEHPEQIDMLQNLGCESGQGFHFAKPLSKQDMDKFLYNINLVKTGSQFSKAIAENNDSPASAV
ncbi:MAG: diguanylate cyclase/phosphodiesterase with and sensor(s) [Acidobacteria bacterium]|nr:diguanylate cyclase/phosphodiesterase with and sensor(s) [Acidobacteriota bacterium]